MDHDQGPVAEFPAMVLLRMPLNKSADFPRHPYVQAAALNQVFGAGELMETLVTETRRLFEKLAV
jgi:hypothetical protein